VKLGDVPPMETRIKKNIYIHTYIYICIKKTYPARIKNNNTISRCHCVKPHAFRAANLDQKKCPHQKTNIVVVVVAVVVVGVAVVVGVEVGVVVVVCVVVVVAVVVVV
jgi:Flp pilus assembly protein TadB